MKKLTSVYFVLILVFSCIITHAQERREVGNLVYENVPETPPELKERIQQYQNTRTAFLQDWLPGGKGLVIGTRFGNTDQLHIVQKPLGARKQITFFDEPVSGATVCKHPSHNGLIFTKDKGGDEFDQLFWYNLDDGKSEMISDGESVNLGVLWSNKGDKFAFTSNRRNKVDFDIYTSDISHPKEADLKIDKGTGYWIATDWSANDTKLIVIQYISSTKSNSYVLDMVSNELTQLNDEEKESVFLAEAWNPTGNKVYAVTDEDKEFATLAEYDIESKDIRYLTDEIPWDIEGVAINKDKSKLAFVANENGFSVLYLMDTSTGKYKPLPNIVKGGQIGGIKFHPNKNELAINVISTQTPGDVYSINIDDSNVTRWTESEVGGLNTDLLPEPEQIEYETFDEVDGKKRMIPAFVYKPKGKTKPHPVLIIIHGGPEGQHKPSFQSRRSFFASELGIAVIAPNVRGSSGYGKSYLKLDNDYNREKSVKDIGSLIEWIKTQPDFDSERIAVFGGSYGGYMVLSSMFQYNDDIRCGVDIVGISNFVTFLENTEAYRQDLRRVEYGDERIPEMREYLESISPTNHAHKIKKPLFVIQGANDPRVPLTESEQMVKSIREANGNVWYMMAKDEGHGFRKKDNYDKISEAIALFLNEFLIKN